ncbi:receptor-like protein 53 [Magnolia sinica]|uniref:receptor-like protein 53 n=1 Tax=Magnolia sinica TaxID=86752 RepID=UPI00265AE1B9|nr:receptor-like protein 53 [Magnolia sinica]
MVGVDFTHGVNQRFADLHSANRTRSVCNRKLRSIQKLNLAYNDFDHSPIPSGFEQLTSLTHLNLSWLQFYGQIPLEISGLTTLVSLDLSEYQYFDGSYYEYLTFENPNIGEFVQNLSSLRELHLDDVEISARGSEWGLALSSALPHLQKLSLRYCGLSGPIHPFLSNLHFLSELDLTGNNFSTVVPNFIGKFSSLTTLRLRNCSLYGKFPESIFRLPNLQTLDVGYNPLLTGEIPPNNTLRELYLSDTGFCSNLRDSFSNSKLLTMIQLRHCKLAGQFPSWVVNLGKLMYLDLSDNGFSGPLPSLLFSLPSLRGLYLLDNQFSGQLSEFHNPSSSLLERIKLDNNKLEGPIPMSIFELTKLQDLSLSSNNFSGDVDLGLFQNLRNLRALFLSDNNFSIHDGRSNSTSMSFPQIQSLLLRSCNITKFPNILRNQESMHFIDLSNNNINGEIPKWLWKLGNVLDLSHNHFSGSIPPCLGQISDALIVLNLGGNAFHGPLLQTFKEECTLETLDLNGNQFEGHVPSSLARCKKLEVLNLGNNQIHDTFPFWIENLSQLHILILGSNKFHGTIGHPQANHTFPLLQIFDLSDNSFTGKLSSNMFRSWKAMMETKSQSQFLSKTFGNGYYQDKVTIVSKGLEMELVKILTAFTVVDLSNNQFHGDIPESVGNLKSLIVLNISYNHFTGRIPASFENIKALESLDLSHNNVSGEIPWQLKKLNFLAVLDLSQNLLVGSIPQGQQFNTFTNKSFLGNSGLCGTPLSKKCEHVEAHASPPSAQSESKYDWKPMWIGFGIGYGVGMGILYWTLALWTNGMREFTVFIDKVLMLIFPCEAFILMHRY